jgi:cell division protein FtsZ
MRLDEFETVGNTVKAFASDNATVVIGTSLDPDMTDEIRVTVVATGIGNEKKPEITLVTSAAKTQNSAPVQQPVSSAAKIEEKSAQSLQVNMLKNEEVSNQSTDKVGSSVSAKGGANTAPKQEKENGYLDIPAFLRRQAD